LHNVLAFLVNNLVQGFGLEFIVLLL